MKWFKTTSKHLLVAIALMLLAALPASAQTPVEVKVTTRGENLVIETATKAGEPTVRMNPDPAYLELSFPAASLQGSPLSKAVDKGLIQKVVTVQEGTNVSARVYVLSKPKAKLSKTATGYVYEVNLREMATGPSRATPAVAQTKPTQATATTTTKTPEVKPVATTSPTPPPAKPQGPKAPVTAKFENTPLKTAIEQIAALAGMTAEVGPGVVGNVNGTFTNLPMDEALQKLISPMALDLTTSVTNDKVIVDKKKPVATTPTQPATTTQPVTATQPVTTATQPATQPRTVPKPPETVASTTVATPGLAREYFPFQKKSAEKAMEAAKLAFPNLSFAVDPDLNVLMVEGSPADIAQLEKYLRAQSPK